MVSVDLIYLFLNRSKFILFGSSVIIIVSYTVYRLINSSSSKNIDNILEERNFRTTVLKIAYLETSNKLISVEKCTGAKIKVSEKTSEMFNEPVNFDKLGTIRIRGNKTEVNEAFKILSDIACDLQNWRRIIHKTESYRIKGKGGRAILMLRRKTGAYVRIDKLPELKYIPDPTRKTLNDVINIIGYNSEIEEACKEIDRIVSSIRLSSNDLDTLTTNLDKSQISIGNENYNPIMCVKTWLDISKYHKIIDLFNNLNHDGYIEVWVTSFTSPNLFWVQPYSFNSELSKIENFDNESKILNIKVGDIVAAPFQSLKNFLRAIVIDVEGNKCEVFFIDFGDLKMININELGKLNDYQKSKPWLASPCTLRDIKPFSGSSWSKEALKCFMDISNVGVTIPSKMKIYNGEYPYCVDLVTNDYDKVNVSDYLISKSLANKIQKTISESIIFDSSENEIVFSNPRNKKSNLRIVYK